MVLDDGPAAGGSQQARCVTAWKWPSQRSTGGRGCRGPRHHPPPPRGGQTTRQGAGRRSDTQTRILPPAIHSSTALGCPRAAHTAPYGAAQGGCAGRAPGARGSSQDQGARGSGQDAAGKGAGRRARAHLQPSDCGTRGLSRNRSSLIVVLSPARHGMVPPLLAKAGVRNASRSLSHQKRLPFTVAFRSSMDREGERLVAVGQSPSRRRLPVVVGSVAVLLLGAGAMAAAVWHQRPVRGVGPVELAATKPWGVDFDIRFSRGERQWQITNLVLHPPAPPPAAGKAPPMVMTKATFPYYELQAMNKADSKVKE